jgi:hypothetical protein
MKTSSYHRTVLFVIKKSVLDRVSQCCCGWPELIKETSPKWQRSACFWTFSSFQAVLTETCCLWAQFPSKPGRAFSRDCVTHGLAFSCCVPCILPFSSLLLLSFLVIRQNAYYPVNPRATFLHSARTVPSGLSYSKCHSLLILVNLNRQVQYPSNCTGLVHPSPSVCLYVVYIDVPVFDCRHMCDSDGNFECCPLLPLCLRQGLSLFTTAHTKLVGLRFSRVCLPSYQRSPGTLHMHCQLYMGSWDLKWGSPHCTAAISSAPTLFLYNATPNTLIYMSVRVRGCHDMGVQGRGQLESWFSPSEITQVIRVSGKCFYSLSHFAGPPLASQWLEFSVFHLRTEHLLTQCSCNALSTLSSIHSIHAVPGKPTSLSTFSLFFSCPISHNLPPSLGSESGNTLIISLGPLLCLA